MREEDLIRALSDPKKFRKLIINSTSLKKAAKAFPDYKNKLIECVLSNPENFKQIIKCYFDISVIVEHFPNQADALIQLILSDPAKYKRLITNNFELMETVKNFKNQADALIQPVLSDPADFKRLISSDYELKLVAEQFPNYPVLQSASVKEALAKIQKKFELNKVKTASRTLGQESRNPRSLFSTLPKDMLIEISKKTANPKIVSEAEAEDAAQKSFNKPEPGKK